MERLVPEPAGSPLRSPRELGDGPDREYACKTIAEPLKQNNIIIKCPWDVWGQSAIAGDAPGGAGTLVVRLVHPQDPAYARLTIYECGLYKTGRFN